MIKFTPCHFNFNVKIVTQVLILTLKRCYDADDCWEDFCVRRLHKLLLWVIYLLYEVVQMLAGKKKETLKTIAETLNVTHTTVSNVFNRPEKVSPELRAKVLAYAESINYTGPSGAGRFLRTGKSGTLGVIFNDNLSYVFTDRHDIALMRGIAEECEINGINIALMPLRANNDLKKRMMSAIVDGYILNATYNDDEIVRAALSSGLPVVTTDFKVPGCPCVMIDDRVAMVEICNYLLNKGHTNFGIISFPIKHQSDLITPLSKISNSYDNDVAWMRINACIKTLSQAGIDINKCMVAEQDHNENGGEKAAKALLTANPDITAIICLSDRFAWGAYSYCQSQHIEVPGKIAITGFDDIDIQNPPIKLTTIRQPIVLKGRQAAEMLINNQLDHDCILDYEFIIRDSA